MPLEETSSVHTCVQRLSGGSSGMALLHDVAEQDLGDSDVFFFSLPLLQVLPPVKSSGKFVNSSTCG